ncbi:phosphate ABC transporter substrate-binding protein [Mastigocladus laminosus UU774]|nr:phosphate ABC transporter substrate-binding protein [Mastigocladus laminosus UU774]
MKKRKLISIVILLVVFPVILGLVYFINQDPKSKDLLSPTDSPPKNSQSRYKNFIEVPDVPVGEFKYGGSTTSAPIRGKGGIDQKIRDARPEFKLKYVNPSKGETPGSNTGIRMVLNNRLDFSISSRKLTSDEEQQGLKQIPVAIDAIAIAVNHNLKISQLTVEQIKKIYTGNFRNWNQIVPGVNLEIKPYTRHPKDGGTVQYFLKDVLKIKVEDLGANVESVRDTTHGVSKVSDNEGGIYFASAAEVVKECTIKPLPLLNNSGEVVPPYKPPFVSNEDCYAFKNRIEVNTEQFRNGSYPITRNLYVIVKENDKTKKQAGEAYANLLLTNQGQELLEETGFVRINAPPLSITPK